MCILIILYVYLYIYIYIVYQFINQSISVSHVQLPPIPLSAFPGRAGQLPSLTALRQRRLLWRQRLIAPATDEIVRGKGSIDWRGGPLASAGV